MTSAGEITVQTFTSPFAAVRTVLHGADDALLAVAFVKERGVNLIEAGSVR